MEEEHVFKPDPPDKPRRSEDFATLPKASELIEDLIQKKANPEKYEMVDRYLTTLDEVSFRYLVGHSFGSVICVPATLDDDDPGFVAPMMILEYRETADDEDDDEDPLTMGVKPPRQFRFIVPTRGTLVRLRRGADAAIKEWDAQGFKDLDFFAEPDPDSDE